MKRNPYQDAAKLELEIVDLQIKLNEKERALSKVISKLKASSPDSKNARGLRDSLSQREKDIHRTRAKLKQVVDKKRKFEREGKKLQFGGLKKQKERIATNRALNKEIEYQDMLLSQMKNLKLTFIEGASNQPRKSDLFISHASEDKDEIVKPLADAIIELGV